MIRVWYTKLLLKLSSKKSHDKFKLFTIKDDPLFFKTAIEALELVKGIDEKEYQDMQSLMPNIAHLDQGYDSYSPELNCFIVEDYHPDNLLYFSSLLVYEVSFARLCSQPVKSRAELIRYELISLKRQYNFIVRYISQEESWSQDEKDKNLALWRDWYQQRQSSGAPNKEEMRNMSIAKLKAVLFRKK